MKKAIILHDKYTEEIIGTVLLNNENDYELVTDAWDKYQETYNSNRDIEADIYMFVADGNWEFCEVLHVEFYQPNGGR
jgi:hypothetical protein